MQRNHLTQLYNSDLSRLLVVFSAVSLFHVHSDGPTRRVVLWCVAVRECASSPPPYVEQTRCDTSVRACRVCVRSSVRVEAIRSGRPQVATNQCASRRSLAHSAIAGLPCRCGVVTTDVSLSSCCMRACVPRMFESPDLLSPHARLHLSPRRPARVGLLHFVGVRSRSWSS
jgi:hypothetical protein